MPRGIKACCVKRPLSPFALRGNPYAGQMTYQFGDAPTSAASERTIVNDGSWPNAVDGYSENFPHIARMRRARSSKRYEPASATRPEITPVTMASAKGMS